MNTIAAIVAHFAKEGWGLNEINPHQTTMSKPFGESEQPIFIAISNSNTEADVHMYSHLDDDTALTTRVTIREAIQPEKFDEHTSRFLTRFQRLII